MQTLNARMNLHMCKQINPLLDSHHETPTKTPLGLVKWVNSKKMGPTKYSRQKSWSLS